MLNFLGRAVEFFFF